MLPVNVVCVSRFPAHEGAGASAAVAAECDPGALAGHRSDPRSEWAQGMLPDSLGPLGTILFISSPNLSTYSRPGMRLLHFQVNVLSSRLWLIYRTFSWKSSGIKKNGEKAKF